MKPWREVAFPHQDVLEGNFQQSEFAADIAAVQRGAAPPVYQDAPFFFQRTYITEGMRLLLSHVIQRLSGQGGEPVIQLQTAFGGGKTHTMLAVYHVATRRGELKELLGISSLLDHLRIMNVPRANVAVLDGNSLAPAQPRARGGIQVRTLWGELAWQLGGEEGYALVAESDRVGTSPGKDHLRTLLERFSPCVILVDELVAYVRQLPDTPTVPAGTYDANLSFIQALTEAIKAVPQAIMLASLPESEAEAGSSRGIAALRALEKIFGRVHALWRPVATEEAFEIVRRRLFEPILDTAARDEVCRAFVQLYKQEETRLPPELQEPHYLDRLQQSYPIHPEVFDRLYEDWTTLEQFQRTRGVLKLMARVIHRLWLDNSADLMILPSSLPLRDNATRTDALYFLPRGWDAVIDKDIDGDHAGACEQDAKEPRFGAVMASRRVARTLFLGSAPSSGGQNTGVRGMDRARILLGCLQPGQSSAVFSDALTRLCDRLHYLNTSGDKAQGTTRYWFDIRTNLRREMEAYKRTLDSKTQVEPFILKTLQKPEFIPSKDIFGGVHVFTQHADVPDDEHVRLVILPLSLAYSRQHQQGAFDAVLQTLRLNGTRPRQRANRLLFLAPDLDGVSRLGDVVRTALAWDVILEEIKSGRRQNMDRMQESQAARERDAALLAVPRAVRECFKWLLNPMMHDPTDKAPSIEVYALGTSGGSFTSELERTCRENELVLTIFGSELLHKLLKDFYWKEGKTAVSAGTVWQDITKYLYLSRLLTMTVFNRSVSDGVQRRDRFALATGATPDGYQNFTFGKPGWGPGEETLLIDPAAALAYEAKLEAARLELARLEQERLEQAQADARARAEAAAREAALSGAGDNGNSVTGGAPESVPGQSGSAGQDTSGSVASGSSAAAPGAASGFGSGTAFVGSTGRAPDSTSSRSGTAGGSGTPPPVSGSGLSAPGLSAPGLSAQPTLFHGTVDINAAVAKLKLAEIAQEVIALLHKDPNARIKVTLELEAEFSQGVSDTTRRAVSENARTLGFKLAEWE